MIQVDLSRAEWRKSSLSSGNGQCLEVADFPEAVAVRDSKNPDGPVLVFTIPEWRAFIGGVTNGEFNR